MVEEDKLEQNNDPDYLLFIEKNLAETKEIKNTHFQRWIAGMVAWGCELGNFPNAYFNLIITAQTLTEIVTEIEMNDDLNAPAKAICYFLAGHFALNTLINDLLLVIPAEIYQIIYQKLTLKQTTEIIPDSTPCIVQWSRTIFLIIIYSCISVLSAGGAIGALEMFFIPVLKKTLGIFAAAIGTFLGFGYSHFYYTDSILEAIEFFESCIKHPLQTFRNICDNPGPAIQIAKSFTIVSVYYSTMGVFYLTRFAETICSNFELNEKKESLISVMKMTGIFMLITNAFIRFVPIKKRYMPVENSENLTHLVKNKAQFPSGFVLDILLESLITGAMVVFSKHYLNNIYIGICFGSLSLWVRLSGEEPVKNQYPRFSKISTWINFNARFHKSAVLLMSALSHIQNMFRDYAGYDFKLTTFDLSCLAMIIGISIGKNRFEVDNNKLDKHIKYIKKKQEFKQFGTLTNIFKPADAFPPDQKEELLQICYQ